jgi:hypothetical protein
MMQNGVPNAARATSNARGVVLITCFIKIDMTKLHKVTHTRKVPDTCLKSRREDDTNLVKSSRTKPRALSLLFPSRGISPPTAHVFYKSQSQPILHSCFRCRVFRLENQIFSFNIRGLDAAVAADTIQILQTIIRRSTHICTFLRGKCPQLIRALKSKGREGENKILEKIERLVHFSISNVNLALSVRALESCNSRCSDTWLPRNITRQSRIPKFT